MASHPGCARGGPAAAAIAGQPGTKRRRSRQTAPATVKRVQVGSAALLIPGVDQHFVGHLLMVQKYGGTQLCRSQSHHCHSTRNYVCG